MRDPIHARDLLAIELHFFVKRSAHRMEHPALDAAAQRFGIDHQTAIVRTYQPLDPNVAGLPVHFDLGDHGYDCLAAVRVCNPAARQNVSTADAPR